MKKINFITILFILSVQLKSKDSLSIYFNSSYCSSCNSIGSSLKLIKNTIITFYLPIEDSAIADELFDNYSIDKKLFTLKYLPNNFFPQKTRFTFHSIGILKKENQLNDTFYLKNFHSLINKKSKGSIKKIIFNDDIKLSAAARFNVIDDKITISDYTLNKAIVLTFSNNSVKKIFELKSKELLVQDFLNCNCINTEMFKYLEPILNIAGRGKPQLNNAYVNNNILYIYYSLGSPIKNSHNSDTSVQFKGFIKSINLLNNNSELICIKNDGLHEKGLIEGKFHNTSECFLVNNDLLMVPCISKNDQYKNLFIIYNKNRNNYINEKPSENLNNLLPSDFSISYNNKHCFPRKLNKKFYYFLRYPLFFNYIDNKYVYLKNSELQKRINNNSIICDVKESDSNYDILIFENKKLRIESYNMVNFNLTKVNEIQYQEEIKEPMFFGKNEIINFTPKGFDLIEY